MEKTRIRVITPEATKKRADGLRNYIKHEESLEQAQERVALLLADAKRPLPKLFKGGR
jgi:hypothetical protein